MIKVEKMINDEQVKQTQTSGDNSNNIQVNIKNEGLSYTEIKEIIQTEVEKHGSALYADNFIKLREIALETAENRSKLFLNIFTKKLLELPEEILNKVEKKFKDPSFQSSIFEAQKGYIKSGNKEKLELLSNLLTDKAKENNETLKDFLLDEAIETAPKLTMQQINFLTLIMFINTENKAVINWKSFKEIILEKFFLFSNCLPIQNKDIQYLEQMGCIEENNLQSRFNLIGILYEKYKGLFAIGFTKEEFKFDINRISYWVPITHCINDLQKFQIGVLNDQILSSKLEKSSLTKEEQNTIKNFFNKTMQQKERENKLENILPGINEIFKKIEMYKSVFIKPLGTLFALTNYKQKIGENITWDF